MRDAISAGVQRTWWKSLWIDHFLLEDTWQFIGYSILSRTFGRRGEVHCDFFALTIFDIVNIENTPWIDYAAGKFLWRFTEIHVHDKFGFFRKKLLFECVVDEGRDVRHFFFLDGYLIDSSFDLVGIFGLDVTIISFPHDFDGAVEGYVAGKLEYFECELIFILFFVGIEVFLS